MNKIRPYQKEAIKVIEKTFIDNDRQYIQMPTGSGKTFTFLSYARKIPGKILIVVPSIEILNQVYESSLSFYHKSEVSRKGNRHIEPVLNIHIVTISSCNKNYLKYLSQFQFDLLIIDEAHHSEAPIYKRLLNSVSYKKLLGVTATPDRSDGKFIEETLHIKSFSITLSELIKQKYICDIEGYSVKTNIDINDVNANRGDFSLPQLYKKIGTEERNRLIVDTYKNYLKGRKTLIFCINVKHSKEICHLLNKCGVKARHIDGQLNTVQRSTILSGFKKGTIDVITNCQVLTEGFDEPSIDGIILARPTKSRSLFNQMIGRGLRIFPGKENCKIIDIVDNHKRISNFTCLATDNEYINRLDSFKSFEEIEHHVSNEFCKLTETSLVRADLINYKPYQNLEADDTIIEYLNDEDIEYYQPLSLEEGSFLIWKNELKKRIM